MSSNFSSFSDIPSKVDIVVVRDFGSFEILSKLLLMLAELLLLTNCWMARKIGLLQKSQRFSHSETVDDLWSAPSFVFLKMSQGSNRESLPELLPLYEEPRLGLKQLNDVIDRQKVPLQDGNLPVNDPHVVPGFPRLCAGTFPERFRSLSAHVGSREICLVWTEHPKCGTPSS